MLIAIEIVFFVGQFIAFLLIYRLYHLESWSFINKLFMIYFISDLVFGTVENYFMFKTMKERLKKTIL